MLLLSKILLGKLKKENISYCHWKSNLNLHRELDGGELDLYVERESKEKFEDTISELGFLKAFDPLQAHIKNVHHFYGLDEQQGKILHLHVFYEILTGESLTKNLKLDIGDLLLSNTSVKHGVVVPNAKVELIVFIIRYFSKHQSLIEYLIISRDYVTIKNELFDIEKRLKNDLDLKAILDKYFNSIPKDLIYEAINIVKSDKGFISSYLVSKKIYRYLKNYTRYNRFKSFFIRNSLIFKYIFRKFITKKKTKVLNPNGFICAIAGPDATGKSTMVNNLSSTLSSNFKLEMYHLGKPKSSFLTIPFNLVYPFMKFIFNNERNTQLVKGKKYYKQKQSTIIQSISSLVLAYDRLVLTKTILDKASNGYIVICDRWPSRKEGAMDSPRIVCNKSVGFKNKIVMYMKNIEYYLYGKIKMPNLIIQLSVPIDIAISRNMERNKFDKEDSDYVRERHNSKYLPDYSYMNLYNLDTSSSLDACSAKLKNIFWKELVKS
jgi:thymidylate kinase